MNKLFKINIAQPRDVVKHLDFSVSKTALHQDLYGVYARLIFYKQR